MGAGVHCTTSCGDHGRASGAHNHACTCIDGYHGDFCRVPAGYTESYTISGCNRGFCPFCSDAVCGVYDLVPGKTCHDAPVYQNSDNRVLYRYSDGRWWVSDRTALGTCGSTTIDDFGKSDSSSVPGSPASGQYRPWTDTASWPDRHDITVAAGRPW